MVWLVFIIIVCFILLAAVFGAFAITFVRHEKKGGYTLDMFDSGFFEGHVDEIKNGIRYIETAPHTDFTVRSFDGLRLAARYYDENSKRTIILFHGYRATSSRDFSCAVELYRAMGLNVLLVDQRSHGKSEGRLITYGVKERYDVITWVDFVLKHFGNDTEIFLGGMSMGATTVLLSAGLGLPCNVKGIIADCGFTSPVDIIRKVAKQFMHINAAMLLPLMNLLCMALGHFSVYGISTVDALKKSDVPVIFIHGGADGFVPNEMSRSAYTAAHGEKEIYIVDGADHGMSFLVDKNGVTERIMGFISRH